MPSRCLADLERSGEEPPVIGSVEELDLVGLVPVVADGGGGCDVHDPAVLDHRHAVAGVLQFVEHVGRHEDGLAAPPFLHQQVDERLAHEWVEAGARLVQDEDGRVVHEGCDEGGLLLHAFGHPLEIGRGVQLQLVEHVVPILEIDVAEHGRLSLKEGESARLVGERDLAGHVADQMFDLLRLRPAIETLDGAGALVGVEEAHQMADGGGLARTVGADEPERLSLLHLEIDVEDAAPAAVVLGQAVDLNKRHGRSPLRRSCRGRRSRGSTPRG